MFEVTYKNNLLNLNLFFVFLRFFFLLLFLFIFLPLYFSQNFPQIKHSIKRAQITYIDKLIRSKSQFNNLILLYFTSVEVIFGW